MKKQRSLLCPLFLLCTVLLAGCGSFKQTSAWKDREIAIDGKDTDWQGKLTGHGSFSLGLINDDENLYLCLTTSDKNVVSQLTGRYGQAFTLWFDPTGNQGKEFGLRFSREMPKMPDAQQGNRPPEPGKTAEHQPQPEELNRNLKVEILKNGNVVAQLDGTQGIETASSLTGREKTLVFELKVPLVTTLMAKYAIQASAGTPIDMILEASEIKDMGMQGNRGQHPMNNNGMPPMDNGMRTDDTGRGAPPPSMGGGTPPGGNQPGSDSTPEPLKLNAKILLAVKS